MLLDVLEDTLEVCTSGWQYKLVCRNLLVVISNQSYILEIVLISWFSDSKDLVTLEWKSIHFMLNFSDIFRKKCFYILNYQWTKTYLSQPKKKYQTNFCTNLQHKLSEKILAILILSWTLWVWMRNVCLIFHAHGQFISHSESMIGSLTWALSKKSVKIPADNNIQSTADQAHSIIHTLWVRDNI